MINRDAHQPLLLPSAERIRRVFAEEKYSMYVAADNERRSGLRRVGSCAIRGTIDNAFDYHSENASMVYYD